VNANLFALMHIPAGFRIERIGMATSALRLAAEKLITTFRSFFVKTPRRRNGSRERHLEEMQRCNLRSNQIILVGDVSKVMLGCNGEFIRILQTRIKERS